MRIVVRIIQVIVGVLFIVSGLVKANDPLGLGYKMQEFFELWNSSLAAGHFFAAPALIRFFELLHDHALLLSVIMITLEIGTGVALLIGWRKKLVLYFLLVLIIFFAFLTGYAYLSGKFTNCGCFGDCLPITPLTSFTKDIVLLVLIILLIAGQKYIHPVLGRLGPPLLLASVVASVALQIFVLYYLPLVDCLPFRKGNNIAEQMKPPPGSIPDSTSIRYIYEKNGKRYEWSPEQLPADYETYTYIDRIDKLVRKGNAEPRIKGFSLTDSSGQDMTLSVLSESRAVLVFALDHGDGEAWVSGFKKVVDAAASRNVPVAFASSNADSARAFLGRNGISVPVYACDFTVIRTAARTNPTLYLLQSGTITGKYGKKDFGDAANKLSK